MREEDSEEARLSEEGSGGAGTGELNLLHGVGNPSSPEDETPGGAGTETGRGGA